MPIDVTKYDIYCFDIFDTAIIRFFLKPTDLFRLISINYNLKSFFEDRVNREALVREYHKIRKDVSIYHIYEDFPYDMNLEISTEMTYCAANPDVFKLYEKVICANKKVYFVSDMYLTKEILNKMLIKCGYDVYEDIFVSSEDDMIKGDGSRFAWLKSHPEFQSSKVVHIGDNFISDYLKPKEIGFESFHYKEKSYFLANDTFIKSKIDFLLQRDSIGKSFIISIYHYWKSRERLGQANYWESFGFFYGGALVVAFCNFINRVIKEKNYNCNNIYFLARDGQIFKLVYDMLFDTTITKYIWASRRCMSFPALTTFRIDEDADQLKQYCITDELTCPQDIIKRFNYTDLDLFEKDLAENLTTLTEESILKCIYRHKDALMHKVLEERNMLMEYLESEGLLDQDDIVLVDVGWGGTIQDSLTKLVNNVCGHNKKVVGIYIGVNNNAKSSEYKTGYLFDGDNSEYVMFLDLIELLTSSPQNAIVRIDIENRTYVPVNVQPSSEEKERQKASYFIQKGILEFASIIKDRSLGDLNFIAPTDFKDIFEALSQFPSSDDIEHLGKLRHAMTIGSNYSKSILTFNQGRPRHAIIYQKLQAFVTSFLNKK